MDTLLTQTLSRLCLAAAVSVGWIGVASAQELPERFQTLLDAVDAKAQQTPGQRANQSASQNATGTYANGYRPPGSPTQTSSANRAYQAHQAPQRSTVHSYVSDAQVTVRQRVLPTVGIGFSTLGYGIGHRGRRFGAYYDPFYHGSFGFPGYYRGYNRGRYCPDRRRRW